MGWFSAVFDPVLMKQSVLVTSEAVLLIAEEPIACSKAATEPAWHRRVQWSMLFVQNKERNNF